MEDINRNATGPAFGWDFQINSAILLFLINFRDIDSIRVEGLKEDIEIHNTNRQITFVQCKSTSDSPSPPNRSENNRSALESLAEAYNSTDCCESLIFAVNYDMPIIKDKQSYLPYSFYDYSELPSKTQDKIKSYLQQEGINNFDYNKLKILCYRFTGKDFYTRYDYIISRLKYFFDELEIHQNCEVQTLMIWQQILFHNATEDPHDMNIKVSKAELMWTILAQLLEKIDIEKTWIRQNMDEALFEEVIHQYNSLIKVCESKIQLCFDVVFDYKNYNFTGVLADKLENFINDCWPNYVNTIASSIGDETVKEIVTKVVLYKIINNRIRIAKIKDVTNLN